MPRKVANSFASGIERDFPRQDGFERDTNRQRLADILDKGIWFVFNNGMLQKTGIRVNGIRERLQDRTSFLGGLISRETELPVTMVPAYPIRTRLALSGLVYARR